MSNENAVELLKSLSIKTKLLGDVPIYLLTLKVNQDSRGNLIELVRNSWCDILKIPKIQQVYSVSNEQKNTIRAFHQHENLWDYFTIVSGKAKFILAKYDMLKHTTNEISYDNINKPELLEFVLSDKLPQILVVPPPIFHGWQSLTDNTVMVSIASEEYNSNKPDETRISWDTFGKDIWGIEYK
jgi:dTDP-4-dehydrorhamnose 3,5-epimerase